MDFELSEDTLMLRDMLRHFIEDEAKPLEMKFFASGELEPKERARLRTVIEQMGLWGATVPEKFGGGGLDMITTCLLEAELGKTFLPIELGDVPPLLYACRGDQITRYLKPALAGKRHPILALREPVAIQPESWTTSANPTGDTYTLNGLKSLAFTPAPDDFLVVFAKAPAGITTFMLDVNQPGIIVSKNGSITLHLDSCQVNSGALLGECGQAFALGAEEAPRDFIRLGARALGQAQRLLEMAVAYANDWQSLGVALKERPAVQRMLAEAQVEIESTRWLVYHAAWLADKKEPLRVPAAEVRLATGELLAHVTDLVTLIYGGTGPSAGIELQRFVRSAMPMEALELGLECARRIIAAQVLTAGKDG